MTFFLRILGIEVFSCSLQLNGDGRTRPVWIDGTGGTFELAEEDYSADYDEEFPDETCGFGFRGQ